MSFETGISLHVKNSCSSLYDMLCNTSFLKVVSDVRPAAYAMYKIGVVLRELMIKMLYMMDAIWLKVLIEFDLQT